ncbi:hypothetical protein HOY80DRAFT_958819 [Tuber brumale]|nr:hypothetical protein HOY80DRAFT_958819 [Tuber brumale]
MPSTFSLFVCAGINIFCCFRSTDSTDKPAKTTLEAAANPIPKPAPDQPATVATTAQILGELPSTADLVMGRHS